MAIDLFCGLGGWTEGLLAEGYDVIGFDIERHDYGDDAKYPAQLVLQDVKTLHGRQFKDAALIVASPPCQEYSYMAMPWSIAKAKAAEYRNGTRNIADLTALFDACFRLQREAIEAAGHFIPLVVENVRGAIPWVGRSRWNFGSFHLWGDVPALMPMTKAIKVPGFRFDGSGKSFQSESVKVAGLNWSNFGKPDYKAEAFNTTAEKRLRDGVKVASESGRRTDIGKGARFTSRDCGDEGMKNSGGSWFGVDPRGNRIEPNNGRDERGCKGFTPNGGPLGKNELGRKHGSKSKARKAASAAIAKIPFPLSQHIARYWAPREPVARCSNFAPSASQPA